MSAAFIQGAGKPDGAHYDNYGRYESTDGGKTWVRTSPNLAFSPYNIPARPIIEGLLANVDRELDEVLAEIKRLTLRANALGVQSQTYIATLNQMGAGVAA